MFGRVMVAIGGIVVAALFVALLAPFVVDWSSFRVEFENQASRVLGKKVSVHGEVDARLLPFPSVTLHDVRVGQDVDGQPQAQVARFSMDMELAPFLSGEARIFDMRIEDPVVRVRIQQDGTLDWMRGSRPAIPTRVVVIEDIHIVGGQIAIVDEQSERSRILTGLSAEMSAASLAGPWRGDGNVSLDGQAARFSLVTGAANVEGGKLPLRIRLWPDEEPVEINLQGELAVAGNVPTYSGSFAANVLQEEDESEPATPPLPGPRVKGSFDLTNDRIRVSDYRLEVGELDDPYVVTGEATLDTGSRPEFLLTAEGQQIDINQLGQGARGKTGRDAAASAQRRLQAFVEVAASIPIPQVPGRASLKLPAVVLNDTTIRDIQLDVRPAGGGWTVDKVLATLPGRTRMEANGGLVLEGEPSFVGDVLFASTQPSGLADWLSGHVDPAIRQLGAAGFSAKVDLTTRKQLFTDLELAIGAATLRGQIERGSDSGQGPDLLVDLSGDEIDIDAMRALASLVTGEDAGHDVLDHRLEAKLRAERFTAMGVAAENVDTAFTMSGGVLSLTRLSVGNLAGAEISAEGRVEGSLLAYSGSGKMSLKAVDAAALMELARKQLPGHPVMERLAANASYFRDADLSADLSVGEGGGGLHVDVSGKINGSTLSAVADLPNAFDITGGNAMSLTVSLSNPQSEILLGQAGQPILPFGGDGAGTLSLDIRHPAEGSAKAALDFKTERTALTLAGDISLLSDNFGEGRGHVMLQSADIEPYLLLTGIGMPQFGRGLPVKAETDFVVTKDRVQIVDLSATAAGNDFAGNLSLDRTVSRVKVEGRMKAGLIDLEWLGEAVYGPLADPVTGRPSTASLALPVFGDSEYAIDLSAREFDVPGFGTVSDMSGRLTHSGGGIAIEGAAGKWRGGGIEGRLMMSNGNGTGILQTKIHVQDADISALSWQSGTIPVATGRMTFDASAEASGGSLGELMSAVTGSGEIRLSDLAVHGINAELLDFLKMSADGVKGELAEKKVRALVKDKLHEGAIEIGQVGIPFTITAGDLRIQEVRAQSSGLTLSAEGRARLIDATLDAVLALQYDPGKEQVAGGEPTVKLIYSGDLGEPDEQVDVSAMANYLSMRAYEQERRRVEMLQSSVLEKQRLRREVALYNFRSVQRAAEKARLEEEEKARLAMIEAAKAAEEERRRQRDSLELQIPPTDGTFAPDEQPLAPFGSQGLPGIGQ